MAGKTAEESKRVQLAHYKNLKKDKGKNTTRIMLMPVEGSAFTLEGNSETIMAYLALKGVTTTTPSKQEFVGLASDTIPPVGSLQEMEDLKIDVWIVLEEELRTDTEHEKSNHDLTLSCETQTEPFFLDSGATVHISPDASDFIMLKPISKRPIQGVGGTYIAATGVSTI